MNSAHTKMATNTPVAVPPVCWHSIALMDSTQLVQEDYMAIYSLAASNVHTFHYGEFGAHGRTIPADPASDFLSNVLLARTGLPPPLAHLNVICSTFDARSSCGHTCTNRSCCTCILTERARACRPVVERSHTSIPTRLRSMAPT
jgi:hypothetical protein